MTPFKLPGHAKLTGIMLLVSWLAACSGGSSDSAASPAAPAAPLPPPPPPPTNSAPTISGSPGPSVAVGNPYLFVPAATDPDGDDLSFTISNRPGWANFRTTDGRLSGTPAAGTEGAYDNIQIAVSDGIDATSLPAFSIEVVSVALGSATLSWNAPDQNTDGSTLTDLAGYRIYYGTSAGAYSETIDIQGTGMTTYVVDNLSPGTYYFSVSALNSSDIESDLSNEASKDIN